MSRDNVLLYTDHEVTRHLKSGEAGLFDNSRILKAFNIVMKIKWIDFWKPLFKNLVHALFVSESPVPGWK